MKATIDPIRTDIGLMCITFMPARSLTLKRFNADRMSIWNAVYYVPSSAVRQHLHQQVKSVCTYTISCPSTHFPSVLQLSKLHPCRQGTIDNHITTSHKRRPRTRQKHNNISNLLRLTHPPQRIISHLLLEELRHRLLNVPPNSILNINISRRDSIRPDPLRRIFMRDLRRVMDERRFPKSEGLKSAKCLRHYMGSWSGFKVRTALFTVERETRTLNLHYEVGLCPSFNSHSDEAPRWSSAKGLHLLISASPRK